MMTARVPLEPVPLGDVIGRLQGELDQAALMSTRIQDAVSVLLTRTTITGEDLHQIQQLDIVAQHLASLEAFLRHLAPQIQHEWTVVPGLAASCITLSNLALRLTGAAEPARGGEDDAEFF